MSSQIQITGETKVKSLTGVLVGTTGVVSSLAFDVAGGVPKLDVNGKILVAQLPNSVMEYKGTWSAATNTPTLVNGTGNQGDVYLCNVAGTVDFGAGAIAFVVGDQVIYSGSIWQRASGSTGTVTSVGITESGDSLNITGSPITTSGTINIGFNGTNLQYVNGAGNLTTFPTLITSIGLSMPSAFSVANSPLTANGTIAVTGAGVASQYIRGDGTLADFPSSGGGGSSVSYYLNGGTSQGTIGGTTYYEMSKTAVIGTGVDFAKSGDGFIVAFLTDANDPAQLNIPAGNWNYEIYASMSANGGTPQMYAELYKYDGTTFTLIATSSNEIIYDGTALNLYTFAMAVPDTSLTLTDRLAVKLYATNSGGKTTTIHTQDGHLCQIITTFSTGITALNGLTAQVQYFQTGTSGTDFNISSTTATHTFNIPDASATARGLITTGTQTIAGIKTFTSGINVDYIGVTGDIGMDGSFSLKQVAFGTLQSGYTNLSGQTNGLRVGLFGGYNALLNFSTSGSYTYTFPNATGTLALTSDLGSYLPLAGGTMTGAIVGTTSTFTNGGSGIGVGITLSGASGDGLKVTHSAGRALNIASSGAGYGIIINNDTGSTSAPFTIQKQGSNVITMSDTGAANFTGQLTLGSTITNGSNTYTLPSATGTLALTSDLSGYLPLTGGTLTGNLNISIATSGDINYLALNDSSWTSGDRKSIGWYQGGTKLTSIDSYCEAIGSIGLRFSTYSSGHIQDVFTLASTGVATFAAELNGKTAVFTQSAAASVNVNSTSTASYSAFFFSENSVPKAYLEYINSAYTDVTRRGYLEVFGNVGGVSIWTNSLKALDINTSQQATFISSVGIGGQAVIYGGLSGLYALQNGNSSYYSYDQESGIVGNGYYDGGWKYKTTNLASRYIANVGTHKFQYAASGTAGAALTWVDALSIASTGAATFSSSVTAGSNSTIVSSDGTYGAGYGSIGFGGNSNGYNRVFGGVGTGDGLFLASATGKAIYFRPNGGTADLMTITSGGNVLIGTTTDSGYKLDVNGTGRFIATSLPLRIQSTTNYETSTLGTATGTMGYISSNGLYGMYIGIGNSGNTWLQSQRNDGGTSAYNLLLQPNGGNVAIGATTASNVRLRIRGVDQTASNYGLIVDNAVIDTFLVRNDGNVSAYGSVTATSFFESSDSRLKTLIQDNYQTKGIASITPKLYTKNGKVELGYYAQDFVGVLDSAVSKGSDDMLSLSYREVLVAKVYALEQRIKELENK